MTNLTNIINKSKHRINAFCIKGSTTTGKNLVLNLVTQNNNYETVQRNRNYSQFFLQNLFKKTVALMEEPRITSVTVNHFKDLLGGLPLDIHLKHQGYVRLEKIPVLILTNYNLGTYINSTDRCAMYKKIYRYKFKCKVDST